MSSIRNFLGTVKKEWKNYNDLYEVVRKNPYI